MTPIIIAALVAALIGLAIGWLVGKGQIGQIGRQQLDQARLQAEKLLLEARQTAERTTREAELNAQQLRKDAQSNSERLKQQKLLEAKEHILQKRQEFDEEVRKRKEELIAQELKAKDLDNSLKQQKQQIDSRVGDLKRKEQDLEKLRDTLNEKIAAAEQQQQAMSVKQAALDTAHSEHIRALEKVACLTEQAAKEELIKLIKDQAESEAFSYVKERVEEAKITASKEAKKIVIQSIQRMAAEYAIENTVSVFPLESDDLKGQIIGREGRNIRALEAATGAEFIVDDTPEAIAISSFDPVRRELARLSLQRLVADGRIHPARIEEIVAKTRKQLEEQIMEIGQRTVIELNIHGLHGELVRMVGRMRFRSSYGQNLLKHSVETANLCAIMASELGLGPKEIKMAKRAGLLHDIGKVTDEETELSHALLGMKLCEKYGEKPSICNAVGAHHDEIEMKFIIAPIVQACDAISGARPGARREILESYIQRIKDLETIAESHKGVQKAYALQAGRELRVMVEADKVSDQESEQISFAISRKIQDEMQYPGQIKVTVIREKRAVSFAR